MMYNVLDFGAKPDGITDNTEAFRRAIDSCVEAGGGVVYFPAGEYAATVIELKSNITLLVEKVCFKKMYSKEHSFFAGENIENVVIRGNCVVDCSQSLHSAVNIKLSKNIVFDGLVVKDGWKMGWAVVFYACSDIKLLNCKVLNWVKDGIDIVCCRNVLIDGAVLDNVGDDSICLKNESLPFPDEGYYTENIIVSNSIIKNCMKRHPAFKIGTGTAGVFRNIIMHDCIIENMETVFCIQLMRPTLPETKERVIENVKLSNIIARNCRYFTDITQMDVERPIIRKLIMDNIILDGLKATSRIIGMEGIPVENITMRNITFGKQAITAADDLMELKHVNNVTISDWNLDCEYAALLHLTDCKNVRVDKIFTEHNAPIITVEGENSRGILFDSNEYSKVDNAIIIANDIQKNAVAPIVHHFDVEKLECESAVMAGEGIRGKVQISNNGEEGFFDQDITANGMVVHSIRTWLYSGEVKTVDFETSPLYVPTEYTVKLGDRETLVEVKETPANVRIAPEVEVFELNGNTAFKLDIKNEGGSVGSRAFVLTDGEAELSKKELTLAPGESTEIILDGELKEGEALVLPNGMKWDYKIAANTYSKFRAWDNCIEITAGGKLYSASGELEYNKLYEYAALYKTIEGDFSAKFRLVSQEASGQYAAAGIIICSDMTKANECKGIVLHHNAPKYGSMSIFRADCDGDGFTERNESLGSTRIGYWLRVDKIGNKYTGYISPDGVEWELLKTDSGLNDSYEIEGDVAIHDVGIYGFANSVLDRPGKAVFENFEITPIK